MIPKKFRTVIDLTGRTINKWTVIERSFDRVQKNKAFWLCRCDCGMERIVLAGNLLTKSSKSCGCLKRSAEWKSTHRSSGFKHGGSGTKEYMAWRAMINRCYNKNVESYSRYGARGISVCAEWRKSFPNFLRDVGICPEGKNSIGRKDSNGNYEKSNVRWESPYEQSNNKCDNIVIEFRGKSQTLAQWTVELGLKYESIHSRIRDGWSTERALTTPIRSKQYANSK